jgi:hypothetical protein
LFAAMGAALGICGFAIARNIAINPDVRWVSLLSLRFLIMDSSISCIAFGHKVTILFAMVWGVQIHQQAREMHY